MVVDVVSVVFVLQRVFRLYLDKAYIAANVIGFNETKSSDLRVCFCSPTFLFLILY